MYSIIIDRRILRVMKKWTHYYIKYPILHIRSSTTLITPTFMLGMKDGIIDRLIQIDNRRGCHMAMQMPAELSAKAVITLYKENRIPVGLLQIKYGYKKPRVSIDLITQHHLTDNIIIMIYRCKYLKRLKLIAYKLISHEQSTLLIERKMKIKYISISKSKLDGSVVLPCISG